MRVSEVGDETVYGKLSKDTVDDGRQSPLQLKLADLARGISKFGYLGACLVVAIYLMLRIVADNGWDIMRIAEYISDSAQLSADVVSAVIMGITVIVVSVPEGLPLMIAIVCSLNMKKMMKEILKIMFKQEML